MPSVLVDQSRYLCNGFAASRWATDGLWDESAQVLLLEPLSSATEFASLGFLQVGRPGVDGIGFGFRALQEGFWAYHPNEQRFQLLAPTVEAFVAGWTAGTITV
jgi:hypothetical protein